MKQWHFSTHCGNKKSIKYSLGTVTGNDNFVDSDVHRRIILKRILKEWNVKVWTRFNPLRIRISDRLN
jgi:hypothetical protein